ncbi:MAG: glycosyltransferase family 2 protein [Bacteroidales bacterium]|nr:glycosyltransferase family 2 protein [Bacteroidales bacterium]
MPEETKSLMKSQRACVIIPTYNNASTVVDVVRSVLHYCEDVFVVNDGCTDDTMMVLQQAALPIKILAYTPNKGKGTALTTGFREALRQGFRYALTLDSDGQHKAEDIPTFAAYIAHHEDALLLGSRGLEHENMPRKNTFANRFSNFWFTVQTGKRLPDTQTGFRLYPLHKMGNMRLFTSRYEAELELLVFSAWRGIDIVPLPIHVYYPPAEERVSHFRPGPDFARISLLNTCLCFIAILYGYPSMFIRKVLKK